MATLSYNAIRLVDLDAHIGDEFYVGPYVHGDNTEWGGTGNAVTWNDRTEILMWSYTWGSVQCHFSAGTDRLSITLTVDNRSSQVLNAINIYPLGLQFPTLPKGFGNAAYAQFHDNLDGPSVIRADYGTGMLVLANEDARPLYVGLSPSPPANHYALQVGTLGDGTQGFLPRAVPVTRPILPGRSDVYSISLRFAPSGTDYLAIVKDTLTNYAKARPQTLQWPDRRPIGELFVSTPTSAPMSNTIANPRRYTFAPKINIQTAGGRAAFEQAVLAYADHSVRILKDMNAQGAIVWDLEGQQYPQPDTSYVGDPTILPLLAPEMDRVADAFFGRFTGSGLKCGMTLRPQQLDTSVSPPHQKTVPARDQAAILIRKISYANTRWGCTLFYVDSDGGPQDATAPSIFERVTKALPEVLIIPENVWPADFAYTAPLSSFTAPYKPLHTPTIGTAMWPRAFTVTYIGDAPSHDLRGNPEHPNQWNEFVRAVKNGDILSFRAWFNDEPLNTQVREIYKAAGASQ